MYLMENIQEETARSISPWTIEKQRAYDRRELSPGERAEQERARAESIERMEEVVRFNRTMEEYKERGSQRQWMERQERQREERERQERLVRAQQEIWARMAEEQRRRGRVS